MYDMDKDQALKIVEELLWDIEVPFDHTDFDQDLLNSLNHACGIYDLEQLSGIEILMWLKGIRDGLNFY